MNATFQTYERMFLAKKRYPKFNCVNKNDLNKVFKLFESGVCYPLQNRDKDGCRIILIETSKWDPTLYTVHDLIRLYCYVITVLLEDEETQIAGIITVYDLEGLTFSQLISPMDMIEFMDFAKNCVTGRQKGNFIVNPPSIAIVLMELFKSLLSEKLKERMFMVKNTNELKKYIDINLLTEKYGGKNTEYHMMKSFMIFFEGHRETLTKMFEFSPDWSKISQEKIWTKKEDETFGSFRKLEID